MAFIVPEVTKSDTRCALSRADFTRQRDVYVLAKRKVASCRRLWQEFEREQPEMARLVVADVESDRANDVSANRHLDVVLSKAEKPKVSKAEKRKARDYRPGPDELFNWQVSQWLDSDNPAEREAARQVLSSRARQELSSRKAAA